MNVVPDYLAEDAARPCPACGAACTDDDRYCEDCGHDLERPAWGAPAQWNVEIVADPEYFERVSAPGVTFPTEPVRRRLSLDGAEVVIGRRLGGDGAGQIDMAGPPEDAGVSHRHAALTCTSDGRWTVSDLGSTNGTFVNDSHDALPPDQPVLLNDGDRIHVGAWTTIVVCRRRARS